MNKKILAISIVIILGVLLTGCATVTYSSINGADGSVTREYIIEIDQTRVDKDVLYDRAKLMVNDYANQEVFTVTFDDENYTIKCVEYYETLTDFYKAYDIDPNEQTEDDREIIDKGFYKDYIDKTTTVFATDTADTFISNAFNYFGSEYDPDSVKYVFKYGTKYKSVHSDADNVEYDKNNAVYIHTWNMDEETRDRQIELISTNPNAPLWYGLCIGGSVLVAGIIFCAAYILKNKRKNIDNN